MNAMIIYFALGLIITLSLWRNTKIYFLIKVVFSGWSLLDLFLALLTTFLIMVGLWPFIIGKTIYECIRKPPTDDNDGPH